MRASGELGRSMADDAFRSNPSHRLLCPCWLGAVETCIPGTEDDSSVSPIHSARYTCLARTNIIWYSDLYQLSSPTSKDLLRASETPTNSSPNPKAQALKASFTAPGTCPHPNSSPAASLSPSSLDSSQLAR